MPSFEADPFEEWSAPEQELWLDMVDKSGHSELMQDDALLAFYDIAFNTPKGDIAGDERAAIMDALYDYIEETYGFDFNEHFDWEAWREAYGND